MNYKQEALNKVQLLIKSVEPDLNIINEDTIESRLISFCLRQLNQKFKRISYTDKENIQCLLDVNSINHRLVKFSNFDKFRSFPLLLVFEKGSENPLVLYRKHNSNYIFNAITSSSIKISANDDFEEYAYELYASLPSKVSGIYSVLNFTFAPELVAGLALLIASAIVMLFNLAVPIFTNLLVNRVLPNNDLQLLIEGLGIVFLVVIGSAVAQYLQLRMTLRLESVTDLRLQTALWDRVMKIPLKVVNLYNSSDLASRVNSITDLRQTFSNGVMSSLLSSIFSVFYFILMLRYDWVLSIFALGFTILSTFGLLFLTSRNIKLQMPMVETGAEITNFSYQVIEGIPQIRSNGAEPFIFSRWILEVSRYTSLQLHSTFYANAIDIYSSLVQPLGNLLVFTVVAWRFINSPDDFSATRIVVTFVSFNAAFSSFNSTLASATNLLADSFGKGFVYWKRAEPVLYAATEKGYSSDSIQKDLLGSFRFSDISYEFEQSKIALFSNINFSVTPGSYTAITGASGCGKSTLLKILLGFVEPTGGEVFIDGIPLQQLAIRYYRKQLGVVIQNSPLSQGSIYEIVCGGIEFSEEKVWYALEKAAIADEINDMPMKLETVLVDGGSNLSGGQAQRLAIARALITDPKVLILDEATSALDPRSQDLITKVINDMGITRISVAHRLSTIRMADNIVVLNNGSVETQGSWEKVSKSEYISEMLKQ